MDGTHSVSFALKNDPTLLGSDRLVPSVAGHYVRLFRKAETAPPAPAALKALAREMVPAAPPVEDGAEDSSLPAGYTYFAQFVAHDLTFDPSTSHQRQTDPRFLLDYRTPRFDLDGVYGRGPDDQPYLYRDGKRFVVGSPFLHGSATDVPRTAERTALIGEPRNDQNAIVSQLHGLFLALHNKLIDAGCSFEEAQCSLRWHYQYVVLTDLLPRLVGSKLLEETLEGGPGSYRLKGLSSYARTVKDLPISVEFSVAAGRFGHSMVRPSYRLNRTLSFATISPDPFGSLVGFAKPMSPSWGIEWDLFVEPPQPVARTLPRDVLQRAYKIDACLADPLARLPSGIVNLAERNLLRASALELPSGQAVAKQLGVTPIADEQLLIGDVSRNNGVPITQIDASFANNCPLWVYVLAEANAARNSDAGVRVGPGAHLRQLGDVGGRIVAETFLALLAADETSILNVPFEPSLGDRQKPFDLGAFIHAALA